MTRQYLHQPEKHLTWQVSNYEKDIKNGLFRNSKQAIFLKERIAIG